MQTRILSALIALAVAGTAAAQAVQLPPPGAGTPPAPMAGDLPPLPPGCAGNGAMPPPQLPRPPAPAGNDGFGKALGITAAQAAKVQQVFERQSAQFQRLDQQRRDLDAETCHNLRSILGDQAMARWSAAAPPPPHGGRGRPDWGRGPGGMTPPPPPPQGN